MTTRKMIDSLVEGNAVEFKNSFNKIMNEKYNSILTNEKKKYIAELFNIKEDKDEDKDEDKSDEKDDSNSESTKENNEVKLSDKLKNRFLNKNKEG